MMSRSLLLGSMLALASLAGAVGCAAPSEPEVDGETVGETQDELTAAASKLIGKYYTQTPALGGFARLTLKADGTYVASIDVSAVALCTTSPCVSPESGTWSAFKKKGGAVRLRVRETGAPARWYDATRSGDTLTLVRSGTTEVLHALGEAQCLDDADCGADEACGPKMCLMYCEIGDPFCCGPSTCEPKAPPPPPTPCFGAWLDQAGVCRTPADGVYPDSCCAGPKCGDAQCAAGEVCCNPLAGVCTAPGMACAQ